MDSYNAHRSKMMKCGEFLTLDEAFIQIIQNIGEHIPDAHLVGRVLVIES